MEKRGKGRVIQVYCKEKLEKRKRKRKRERKR